MYNLLIDVRANIASLQKDMDQAQGVLKRATSGMGSVMRGFFEGIGQELAKGALRGVVDLTRAIGNLANEGDKLGDIADNFRALGGSADSIKKAQQAVLGTVNAFDLMQAANEGLLRGIPNLNERFADLTKYANQFANATGQETLPVLQQLIEAFGSGKAEALKKFGFELGETSSKAENSAVAFEQLTTRMAEMGELTTSVTQGHEAFGAALAEARGQIAIAINDNEELGRVYNELAQAINSIDWKAVGADIASMISSVVSVLPSLKTVAAEISNLSLGLRALTGNMTPMEQNLQKIANLQGELAKTKELGQNTFAEWLFDGAYAKKAQELTAEIDKLKRSTRDLMDNDGMQAFVDGLPTPKPTAGVTGSTRAQRNALEFEKKLGSEKEKSGSKAVEKESSERLKALADYNDEQMRLQAQAVAAEMQQRDSALKGWGSDLGNAIASALGQIDPQLGQIASQFADMFGSELASTLQDIFGGQSNYGNFLGSTLSTDQAHQAGIQGPGMENGQFGGDATGGQNWGGWIEGGMIAVDAAANSKKNDKANKDNSGTGGAVGAAAGAIIAGAFTFGLAAPLGAAIGKVLGSYLGGMIPWGAQNKETISRHGFANYMEDNLTKMNGLTIRDGKGGTSKLNSFVEGSSTRFNNPNWADELNKQSKEVKSTFSGLGEAFKEILGITEDVGSQIALMLGENLKFNVNNARMLVKRLGLSFEEIEKKLVEVGLKGDKTWLEIETQIQGVAEAFKPGLTAVGAFGEAMSNLLGSGAKGFEAVQSIRDIAVEAAEAGIKNFDQLRLELAKTFDPATIDAFFKALSQRGVTSIGELMQLSDRTAGGIVADMQALGVKFTDTGKKIGDSISSNTQSTDANTNALNANTKALGGKAPSAPSSDELAVDAEFARGGVVNGPTRALMGESGPEAVLPLTRRNGKLGVAMFGNIAASGAGGGGYVIHVDARGASPGVEKTVRSALRNSERRVVESIGRNMRRNSRRTT